MDEILGGVPTGDTASLVAAVVFMAILAAVNLRGVGESVKFNVVLTVISLVALSVVILVGLWAITSGDGDPSRLVAFETPKDKSLFVGVTVATTIAFFAMVGFEDSVNMVEETKDPERTFPRIMFTALGVCALLYMLVAVAVIMVIPEGDLTNPSNPEAGILLDVVKVGAPGIPIDQIFPFLTVFAVGNTALINMLMASRLVYGMAKQEVLPPVLGKVLPGRRSPWTAIAFTTVLAMGLIVYVRTQSDSNIVSALSGTTGLLLLCVFSVVNISCLILRRDDTGRGFRAPTAIPVLGAILSAFLVGPWARNSADYIQYRIAAGLLAIGVVLWALTWLANRGLRAKKTGFRDIDGLEG